MTTVLFPGDLHCYEPAHDTIGEGGISSRLSEWRSCTAALVKAAIDHQAKASLYAGDYFINPRPSAQAVLEVGQHLSEMEANGFDVIGEAGNHDEPGPDKISPVEIFKLTNPWWATRQPAMLDLPYMQVAVLPYSKPAAMSGKNPAEVMAKTSQALLGIVRSFAAQLKPGKPSILLGHWAIAEAMASSGEFMAEKEPCFHLEDLKALPFDVVAMGHVHRPQILWNPAANGGTGPLVFHTGSLVRRDFGEEKDLRGAFMVNLETKEADFIPIPARRFVTITLQAPDFALKLEDPDLVKGAIVRVAFTATEEQALSVNIEEVKARLRAAGVFFISQVVPEITRVQRTREATLTEKTGPMDALRKWLGLRTDLSDTLKQAIEQAAGDLLRQIEGGVADGTV